MPKKKTKKTKPAKKAKKSAVKKVKKSKPAKKSKKAIRRTAAKTPALPKEKVLGKIDHYFHKINVAAIVVKAPFKVGDYIHIKGHTTDFVQRIDSMQINHQNVDKVKKGEDVGLKVKEQVREHDVVYLADQQSITIEKAMSVPAAQPQVRPQTAVAAPAFRPVSQTSIFQEDKPLFKPAPKPAVQPPPFKAAPTPPPPPKKPEKQDPYSNTKFFNF